MSGTVEYIVQIWPDEDGGFVAEAPELPGCVSQGDTMEELLTNMADAVQSCIEARRELGLPLRVEFQERRIAVPA
jgi:predicted RNase H-like HicB family nuclease